MTHGDQNEITSATFDSTTSRIATATTDGTAKIWDANSGKELVRLQHDDGVTHVMFSSDDNSVLTASPDGSAIVWDAENGECIAVLSHETAVHDALFLSPNGLIGTASGNVVKFWNVSFDSDEGIENTPIGSYDLGQDLFDLASNGATEQLLVGGRDGSVVVLDLRDPTTPKVQWKASVAGPLKHVALSPDSRV